MCYYVIESKISSCILLLELIGNITLLVVENIRLFAGYLNQFFNKKEKLLKYFYIVFCLRLELNVISIAINISIESIFLSLFYSKQLRL